MIENLNEKLSGSIPVTREELIILVKSHNENSEKHPLENLDVSKITNFSFIFHGSSYNGDLSKWNTSNATSLTSMFEKSEFNNDSLKNWNLKNVESMKKMFFESKFNGNISNWEILKLISMDSIFKDSKFDNFSIFKVSFNSGQNRHELFSSISEFDKRFYNENKFTNFDFSDIQNIINNESNFLDEKTFSKFDKDTKQKIIENNINNLKENIDKNNKFLSIEVNKLNETRSINTDTIETIIVKFQNSCQIANNSLQDKILKNQEELNKILILQKLNQNNFNFDMFIK